jgi:hypothetical protein
MSQKNIGSNFDEVLSENAILEDATAVAVKRVSAWQIEQNGKAQNLKKTSTLPFESYSNERLREFETGEAELAAVLNKESKSHRR